MNENKSQTLLSAQNKGVIQRLEEIIRQKVNGEEIDIDGEKPEGEENHNLFVRRRMIAHRRRLFRGLPGVPLRMRLQANNTQNADIVQNA